jgi:hypothetical protein
MDEMSDDYDDEVYGDTDSRNLPDGAAGQTTSAGDGLAGYPMDGHPDWRAGVFGSGNGLLGMARASDLVARTSSEDHLPFAGQGDPRLMRVSDPVTDWERNSWRWNDATAIAYDLDRKKRQLAQAQTLSGASNAADWGQIGAAALMDLGSAPFAAANAAVGQYMSNLEAPRLQNEINALQSRLDQLNANPRLELGLRPRLL